MIVKKYNQLFENSSKNRKLYYIEDNTIYINKDIVYEIYVGEDIEYTDIEVNDDVVEVEILFGENSWGGVNLNEWIYVNNEYKKYIDDVFDYNINTSRNKIVLTFEYDDIEYGEFITNKELIKKISNKFNL